MATSKKTVLLTAMNGWLSAVRFENQFVRREIPAALSLSPQLALPSSRQIAAIPIKTVSYDHSSDPERLHQLAA